MKTITFRRWLKTFIDEKGLDLESTFEFENANGYNLMPYGVVTEFLLENELTATEMTGIRDMIVRIDFANGDVYDFLRHLGRRIAEVA